MTRRLHIKTGLFFVLIGALLFSLLFFQKQSNHQGRHLFVVSRAPLVALDHISFQNDAMFQRATMLTSPSFSLESTIRHFSNPIVALTSSTDYLYTSQGRNIIQISTLKGADEILSLDGKTDSAVVALSVHPLNQKRILALCESRELLEIDPISRKVRSFGVIKSIPQNMTVQEMWLNPLSKTITVSLSTTKDSLLITLNPANWNISKQEIMLTGTIVKGGFSLSRQLILVVDQKYNLLVIDRERNQIIGNYVANPNFKFGEIHKTHPSGFTVKGNDVYISDNYNQVMKLSWRSNPNSIILNRDVTIKGDKIVLNWKMAQPTNKALYFAELSLSSKDPIMQRRHTLPSPPEDSEIPFGPSKESRLELPYIETAHRSFDISLFAIHAQNGRILTPSISFTVDTEKRTSK